MSLKTPEGYMRNAAGHLVPEDQVREHDKLRDQIVRDLAERAEKLHVELAAYKANLLSEVADLVAISAERYGVQLGGNKGNVSLTTYDGEYKIQRTHAERFTFTEEIEAAKSLIDDCIIRWSDGASKNIRVLVDRAFRTNTQGQLKTSAVLELMRLDIDDDGWRRAMAALRDSIQTCGTSTYIRLYKRVDHTDEYQHLSLDLSGV